MGRLLDAVQRSLAWKTVLPSRLGMDHVSIHITTVLLFPILSLGILGYAYSSPGLEELRSAAITLPVVWLVSLCVRVSAQVLAIGSHGDEFEMVIGPTGNTSTDYELLTGPAILSYAMAGQAATLLMSLLGLLVLAAIAPTTGLTLASIFDFRSGWGSAGWASQILWVNGFLFVLHLLPAVPFDTRALLVGWFRVTQPQLPPSANHRALSQANSHLAMMLAGAAIALILVQIGNTQRLSPWYAMLFVSVYMLMISQLESLKARDQEELEGPRLQRSLPRRDHHTSQVGRQLKLHAGHQTFLDDELLAEEPESPRALDVDEILRKLHREGQAALTDIEKEALLSASKQLQARRRPSNDSESGLDSDNSSDGL